VRSLLRSLLVFALCVVLSFPAVAGEWPLEGGQPQRQRQIPENLGRVFYSRWVFPLAGRFRSSPAAANGQIFFGDEGGGFYALDEGSGALLWQLSLAQRLRSVPATDGRRVFFADYAGVIRAVDATRGQIQWEYPTGGWISGSLLLAAGLVLVGSADGTFYAVDTETGRLAWRYDLSSDLFRAGAALGDGLVIAGTHGGRVVALELATGRLAWSFTVPGRGAVDSSPVVVGKRVFVAASGDGGGLFALELDTGRVLWQFHSADDKWRGLAWREGLLLASEWGEVYAFNADDYQLKWVFRHPPTQRGGKKYWPIIEAPLATAGGVLVTTSYEIDGEPSRLLLLDTASGELLNEWILPQKAVAGPVASNGVLYLALEGRLEAWQEIRVELDGRRIHFPDVSPFFAGNRVMVPARFLAEAMGAKVTWLTEEGAARFDLGDLSLKLWPGRPEVLRRRGDGEEEKLILDVAPQLKDGRLVIPVRHIVELLKHGKVDWDGKTLTVKISRADGRS